MKAELINLGAHNVNKIIEVKDAKALHREIAKHLYSRGWGMDATETPNLYEVYAGFRTVGHVKILKD